MPTIHGSMSVPARAGLWLAAACVATWCPHASAQDAAAPTEPVQEAPDEPTKPEGAKWNVDQPPGPWREASIDTDQGTWISLDVSPDGDTIVFDLLGDLYTIPITGGDATRITAGIAWDMQPRFSPDGSLIAFTSDRTGKGDKAGDNIWVVNADGSNARQITAEAFRLLNAPVWSPDGQYIVARKHFTSRRSLGAGEMWMYHLTGVDGKAAAGLQLTTKPTDQKDVNEPAFSPDGRYLYYSEDASSGTNFEYDKDSNGQIYIINRLDLVKGETERYITGPGGSCRPIPSPDGKSIAFVRRVGPRTGLHLFDIETGAAKLLYDDLERDMQEAWAIHGVYPAFNFTPDGKSIVFWARGKIRRLDLATRAVSEIPFRVRDTRMIAEPVRYPIDAAPDRFRTRAIRDAVVSPDGSIVAYQALGRIYLRDLPDGSPRRLTSQNTDFEFAPAFSPDGSTIVYCTWNDDTLGSVRATTLAADRAWTVTDRPGHYVDPVFSPDGAIIVYSRIGGGFLRSPLRSNEPGIYRVPARGGNSELVTRSGSAPHFGSDNTRLFLTRVEPGKDADNRKLISISLDGKEERTHYTSSWATEFRVSPNGKWVAFVERFNVYLAPFLDTGRAIAVAPKSDALPLAKVSHHAGSFVHFSGDSQRVHWTLGPTLYTRALADSFSFLDGAPETLPEPPTDGIDIGFDQPYAKPVGALAIVGARVITMNPDPALADGVIENATILIEGNRISAVGPREQVTVPATARVMDAQGRTVYPGLIDVHAHGPQAEGGITPQRNWVNLAQLAFGVTTIHDPSNDTLSIFAASELSKAGITDAPRIFSTGTILYGAAGAFKAEVDSLDDALFHLRRMQAIGAFSVKSYNQPRRDQRQQVIEAARQLNMMVVPEGGSTFMHNLTMVVDGHTGIEHTVPVELLYDDVLDLWRQTTVGYTPTLGVAYGGLGGENHWYDVDDVWLNPRVEAFIPPHVIIPRAKRRTKAPIEDYNHIRQARITKQLTDIGIGVNAGGHGQLPGLCTHWELWMFVQGGMTNLEALRAGTLRGAQYIGLDNDLGSITPGKLADLIVLEPGRDPLKDIRDTEHIDWVVANGRVYQSRTMNQIHPVDAPLRPFYWEAGDFSPPAMPVTESWCVGCGRPGLCASHP